jgi:hypothetical protein
VGFLTSALGGFGGSTIGSAVVQLGLDARALEAGLAKTKTEVGAATTSMGGAASKTAGLASAAWIGFGAVAGAAVVKFAADSIRSFEEHQTVVSKLRLAVGSATEAYEEQATALQQLTGFQDEEILSADTVLARFDLTKSQIDALIPRVLDYARATGVDAATAAGSLGKALLGNTRALKTIGIQFTATGDRATDYNTLLGLLNNSSIVGTAKADTMQEKLQVLAATWDDLKEAVGEVLVNVIEPMIPLFTDFIELIGKAGPVIQILVKALQLLLSPMLFLKDLLDGFGTSFGEFADGLDEIANAAGDQTFEEIRQKVAALVDETGQFKDQVDEITHAIQNGAAFNSLKDSIVNTSVALKGQLVPSLEDTAAAHDAAKEAAQEQKTAEDALAGGLLGLVASSDQLKAAHRELNALQEKGITSGHRYDEALRTVLESSLTQNDALEAYAQNLEDSGLNQKQATQELAKYGKGLDVTRGEVDALIGKVYGLDAAVAGLPTNKKITVDVAVNTVASGVVGVSQALVNAIVDKMST